MKRAEHERGPQDLLHESLEAVRRDDAETKAPPRLEALVMRAWDAGAGAPAEQDSRGPAHAFWWAALAASMMVAVAVSLRGGSGAENPDATSVQSVIEDSGAELADDPLESLITADLMLDEDPAFLQYVHMSVEPSALTAFGFPVRDPEDDQPVDVEVLIGLDGLPRAIRHAHYVQEEP